MNPIEKFRENVTKEIMRQGECTHLKDLATTFINDPNLRHYSYHFTWLGRPIIQYPQDIVAMQELIATVKPDLIIETGIAHGGSLIFYASMLELNALCGGALNFHVLGIDIDIRSHNRKAIEDHPIYKRGNITMFEGSSISTEIINRVHDFAHPYKKIMVLLDSNHTHEHVLTELEAYAPLVSVDSYCVVFDTVIENMPDDAFPDRPWGKGNNPMTAVKTFLRAHPEFRSDTSIDDKLLISVAPKGYLCRLS